MKIQDILTDESKWTKGANARHANGNPIGPEEANAACWCLNGALIKAYDESIEGRQVRYKICIELSTHSFSPWNDAPERTFADVRKLIEELDI